jgi:hypothetical protein
MYEMNVFNKINILLVVTIKISILWGEMTCSLVGCMKNSTQKMNEAKTSGTVVTIRLYGEISQKTGMF